MKLVKISGDQGIAASGGLRRGVNLSLLKGAKAGDYVLIHAGFAIEKIDPKEARKTLKAFDAIRR
jgi:hydrogenase expression/formation protein HypC